MKISCESELGVQVGLSPFATQNTSWENQRLMASPIKTRLNSKLRRWVNWHVNWMQLIAGCCHFEALESEKLSLGYSYDLFAYFLGTAQFSRPTPM